LFLNHKWEDKRLWTVWRQAFHIFSLLLISLWMQTWFVNNDPKYFNSATFSKNLLATFICIFWPLLWWWYEHVVLPMFTAWPTSSWLSNTASVIFLWYLCSHPINYHHQYRREADVSHSFPIPLIFLDFPNGIF
jgi:hypothetical protein